MRADPLTTVRRESPRVGLPKLAGSDSQCSSHHRTSSFERIVGTPNRFRQCTSVIVPSVALCPTMRFGDLARDVQTSGMVLFSPARSCVLLGQRSGRFLGRRFSYGARPKPRDVAFQFGEGTRVGTIATDVPIATPRVWNELRETVIDGASSRTSHVHWHVHHFAPQLFWTDVRFGPLPSISLCSCAICLTVSPYRSVLNWLPRPPSEVPTPGDRRTSEILQGRTAETL